MQLRGVSDHPRAEQTCQGFFEHFESLSAQGLKDTQVSFTGKARLLGKRSLCSTTNLAALVT